MHTINIVFVCVVVGLTVTTIMLYYYTYHLELGGASLIGQILEWVSNIDFTHTPQRWSPWNLSKTKLLATPL